MNQQLATARKHLVEIGERIDNLLRQGHSVELGRAVNQLVGVVTDFVDIVSGEAESEVVGLWFRYVGEYNEWPEFAVYWNGVKRGSIRRWHRHEWVAFPYGGGEALHLGSYQGCVDAFRKYVE